ncbi:winged helix-turn-helix domain-containing protein [Rhizobium leguminosarum]|uniref:winged helix-turn-helix domain-containing protein n=1 Tax=Rhizobium leguminosarum TaxID=384 RepID=UPI0013EF1DE2|nr:helix-turn-helix domain-containing protein [Rhizobium leguminosarum]
MDSENRTIDSDRRQTAVLKKLQWDVLLYFLENPGNLITRENLFHHVWGTGDRQDASINVAIGAIRKAFAEFEGDEFIRTLPKMGYRCVADICKRVPTTRALEVAVHSAGPTALTTRPVEQISAATPNTSFGQSLPAPRPEVFVPRALDAAAVLNIADQVLKLSIGGDEIEAARLGLAEIDCCIGDAGGYRDVDDAWIGALLRLLRRVSSLQCGRWAGARPEIALDCVLNVESMLSNMRETPAKRVALAVIKILKAQVGRRLPFSGGRYHRFALAGPRTFLSALTSACEFCEAETTVLAARESDQGTLWEEVNFELTEASVVIARELKTLKDDRSQFWHQKAIERSSYREKGRVSFVREFRLLRIRSLLFAPHGKLVDPENARVARRILDTKVAKFSRDLEWIDLWTKATLLLIYKIKDKEIIDQGIDWPQLVDEIERTVLGVASNSDGLADIRTLRLILRVDRKRRELNTPTSPTAEQLMAIVLANLRSLLNAPYHVFTTLLREIRQRPATAYLQPELFNALRGLCDEDAPLFRALQIGRTLAYLIDARSRAGRALFAIVGPALEESSSGSELSHFGAGALRKARDWNLCANILDAAFKVGGMPVSKRAFVEDFGRTTARGSRHDAAKFARFIFGQAERAAEGKKEKLARSLAEYASELAENFCFHDYSLYVRINRFIVAQSKSRPDHRRQALDQLKKIERKIAGDDLAAQSLLMAAKQMRSAQHTWRKSCRLQFEAVVEADGTASESVRFEARRQFAMLLVDRWLADHTAFAERHDKTKPKAAGQAAIDNFAMSRTYDARLDILSLINAQQPLGYPPGSMIAATLTSIVRDGALAGLIFTHGSERILVRKQFLSNELFNIAKMAIPEWNDRFAEDWYEELESQRKPVLPWNELFLLNILTGSSEIIEATMVGAIFVKKCLTLILPGLVDKGYTNLRLGGSTSYATVIVDADDMIWVSRHGGRFQLQLERIANLRSLQFVEKADNVIQQQLNYVQISWRQLHVTHVDEKSLTAYLPSGEIAGKRKLHTFQSMFKKMFPEVKLDLSSLQGDVQSSFLEDDEDDAFW